MNAITNKRGLQIPVSRPADCKSAGTGGNQEAKIMLEKYYAAFDAYAYESELIHAAQNGLTLRQFDLNRNCYLYNSSLGGISANKYNYTLWHLLKSTLFPYW